jgi:hypothetical protein
MITAFELSASFSTSGEEDISQQVLLGHMSQNYLVSY